MSDQQPSTVTVSILDKDYQVNCPLNEVDELRASAKYLDKQMREIKNKSSMVGLDRIAVMAALNIANDLLKESELRSGTESVVNSLSSKLENALTRIRPKA